MENYGLVNDQFRSPTYVEDLAKGIMLIIENKARGIFHISGKDILTPYQMGIAVAHYLDYSTDPISELSSLNFSQPAKRPARTNLNIEKAKTELGYDPVNFEEGLRKTFS
jgi:dTDP-4-dehydrorhamnose reductase